MALMVVAFLGFLFTGNGPKTPDPDPIKNCKLCSGMGRVSGACAPCNGTGFRPGSKLPDPVACNACGGTGNSSIVCPQCGGTGRKTKKE